jgi:UDP-N-acetylglucosamine transferase subunit ALG13
MIKYVDEARIVITHGGPSSFIMPLQIGKIPVVVPRQKKFDEHVNNHQLEFCERVSQAQGNIIVVEDINELSGIIKDYESIAAKMPSVLNSNNAKFCENFGRIVDEFMKEK